LMPIGLTTRWPESDPEATPVFGRNAQMAVIRVASSIG
jgi:hypothetical protein